MPKASDLVHDFQRRITKSLNVTYRQAPKGADYHERLLYKLLSRAVSYFKLHGDTLQSHERKAVTTIKRYLLSYKLLLQSHTTLSTQPPLWRYATIVDVYHGVIATLGNMSERSGLKGFIYQFVHERQRGLVYDTFLLITQTVTLAQLSAMRERERVERSSQICLQRAAIQLDKTQQQLQATTKHYVEQEKQYVMFERECVDEVMRQQLSQPQPSSSQTQAIDVLQHGEALREETFDSDPEMVSVRDYTRAFNTTKNSDGNQSHRFFSNATQATASSQTIKGTITKTIGPPISPAIVSDPC